MYIWIDISDDFQLEYLHSQYFTNNMGLLYC